MSGKKPMTKAYERTRELVVNHSGEMVWRSGGSPEGGGVWVLTLESRICEVPVHNRRVNALDRLYEAPAGAQTWDDFDYDPPLLPDAFWRLVGVFDTQKRAV